MSETAKEALASHNYWLAAEIYERYIKQQQVPNVESLLGYGDSLARCGRIRESLEIYAKCLSIGSLPLEKLKNLTNALLEDLIDNNRNYNSRVKKASSSSSTITTSSTTSSSTKVRQIHVEDHDSQNYETFSCPVCEGALYQPVTLSCGHTQCRQCIQEGLKCRVCGYKNVDIIIAETDVLVQRLVEKWWPRESKANGARHEADLLMKQGHVAQALERYNLALQLAPNSPLHLSNRAHALLLLNRPQASLADADHAVRVRPGWGRGHYQRGLALSALMRNEEAFLALCTSVVIDKNLQTVRHEITRVLHRVLSSNIRRQSNVNFHSPYDLGEARLRMKRRHMILPLVNANNLHLRNAFITSDCEDNSSGGEEEFSQTNCRRIFAISAAQDNSKLHATIDRLYHEFDKLKRLEPKPAEILIPPSNGAVGGDLDCILCCRLLWKPVTTPCGHTYCWVCLDRCLDYSSSCPLCITPISDYLASSQKTVTEFVEQILKTVAPKEYATRALSHRYELVNGIDNHHGNEEIAVFVCTTSFPWVACPLFVYEPRYRLMVRRCIENGSRQFGISACVNREATGSKRYAEYGTMLEIKDRVLLKDGCSILSTVGRRRFRVLSGGERDGYDTAHVEFIRDHPITADQISNVVALHNKVRAKSKQWWAKVHPSHRTEISRVFGEMPEPEDDWHKLSDGPSWTWWLLAILPLGPQLQIGILGTRNLEKRLRAIEKTIDHMEQRQLSESSETTEETTGTNIICTGDSAINQDATIVRQS